MDDTLTPVQAFFKGKKLLVTGVTGFIGKVLLEKLLRSCPEIEHIYVIIRVKKGESPEQRLEDVFKLGLFDLVRKENPSFYKKVSPISGNLLKENLDISPLDLEKIQNNVNIMIHLAGWIRWNSELRIYVQSHMVATRTLLDIAKGGFEAPEHAHKKDMSPQQLLDIFEWMDEESIQAIQPSLEKKEYMLYMLTKSLTEQIVAENQDQFKTAIVRPCLVVPPHKEPIPGWCDTVQGFTGIGLAIGKGFLRHFYHPGNHTKMFLITVDCLVNSIITTTWYVGTNQTESNETFVVNTRFEEKFCHAFDKEFMTLTYNTVMKYPGLGIYRYPSLTIHSSLLKYKIYSFLDHYIPAYIIDFLLVIAGKKPMMVKLYDIVTEANLKVVKTGEIPAVCTLENNYKVRKCLSEKDFEIFFMDVTEFDKGKFLDDMIVNSRVPMGKEDMSTVEPARRKQRVWKFVTTSLKWCIILLILHVIFKNFLS